MVKCYSCDQEYDPYNGSDSFGHCRHATETRYDQLQEERDSLSRTCHMLEKALNENSARLIDYQLNWVHKSEVATCLENEQLVNNMRSVIVDLRRRLSEYREENKKLHEDNEHLTNVLGAGSQGKVINELVVKVRDLERWRKIHVGNTLPQHEPFFDWKP